ncbi:hypothetical protein SUGI_1279310 [Cryptomeria japonica]|uniref:Uncharacterized protein n=1 Tax=Cryptomeria japonica TaxID=3369 RepID=A0AAD3RP89_CRYJA|nr:hypothetical protein SUGI_1279200 [Cryptomeria japonica]GLJ56981.1 hypothetical protein SUGI_1279310 [Cryptomeria japonica]
MAVCLRRFEESTEEEHLRNQLNKAIVSDDIDVHYLADLIKAIPAILKMRDGHNPATLMLEVTSVAVAHQLGRKFTEIYKELNLCSSDAISCGACFATEAYALAISYASPTTASACSGAAGYYTDAY